MPLIALAYIVFAAGLALGYARLGILATALIGLGVAGAFHILLPRRHKSAVGLTLLFCGAIALARADRPKTLVSSGPQLQRSALESTRDRVGKTIEKVFRQDAPLAKALLIADRQQIPLEMNDAFVAAGLVHILSISGLHVGIIAASIALLLESARLSKRISAVATLLVIALYVTLLGGQPPALRAAAMVGAMTLGRFTQRPTSPWALLAIGAFIPLVQPEIVLNLGYQLSVAGMAALIAGGVFAKRYLKSRMKGLSLKLCTELSISVVATLVSAPLIAWAFGRLSLIGPISNIVATPIVAVLQPLLFLALLLAPAPALARFAADAAHPLLNALDGCAQFFGGLPGAVVSVSPTWPTVVCALAAVCALIVAFVSRYPMRPVIVAATCCAVGILVPFPVLGSGKLEMHMLDVGQGDAILLRTPAGRWVLVDAGRAWAGGDAGRSVVVPYVRKRGGDLAAFILSHPHLDHVGGAATVLEALHPLAYWDAAFAGGNAAYRATLDVSAREHIPWHRVHPGDSVALDGVTLSFLAPDSSWTAALSDANEASSVVLVRYGLVRFLLTGDAEQGEEQWLLSNAASLRADVLKVGHHGSSTSSGDAFIRKVCPQVALISVGAINSYGHPSGDVIAALRRIGARVLRTDHEGTIVVRTDGSEIEVQSAETHWEFSKPSHGSSLEVRSSCQVRS
jgi:competence protein ComEC